MIVVTGGAGFIGSNIAGKIAAGERFGEVVVCDFPDGGVRWKNLDGHRIDKFVAPEDLFPFLKKNIRELRGIIHMGAISRTTETDLKLLEETNVSLTLRLWKFCAEIGVPLIYASSAATYGNGENGFYDFDDSRYLSSLRPLNAYGESKNSTDIAVSKLLESGGKAPPQHVGLKFFNVYGPNEFHKGSQMSAIAQMYRSIKKTGKARLFKSRSSDCADGEQERDFVWVGDAADTVLWFLENPHASGLFNVGTGKCATFAKLAEATFAAMGLPPKIEFIDMPPQLDGHYQYRTCADISKLRSTGCNIEMKNISEGASEYVEKYLSKIGDCN